MVNTDILEGKWKQLQGKVKERWGMLTDNDITRINGKRDVLIGILQEKYGYPRMKAEEEVDDFIELQNHPDFKGDLGR
jgi:uncharacterized protein YjbJ (UPF0337 family)